MLAPLASRLTTLHPFGEFGIFLPTHYCWNHVIMTVETNDPVKLDRTPLVFGLNKNPVETAFRNAAPVLKTFPEVCHDILREFKKQIEVAKYDDFKIYTKKLCGQIASRLMERLKNSNIESTLGSIEHLHLTVRIEIHQVCPSQVGWPKGHDLP